MPTDSSVTASGTADSNDYETLRLDRQLCFALYRASSLMTRLYGPHLQKLDLTYPQYLVLMALWSQPPRSVGELGAELGLNFGTLSPLLKRMESKGLLQRQRQADDERRVSIALTAEGEGLRQAALDMQRDLQCELDLADESVTQLRDGVQQLTRSLQKAVAKRA